MWKTLKQLAIATAMVTLALIVPTVNADLNCTSSATSLSNIFYYDSACNVRSCYSNYCSCIGQSFFNTTGQCHSDTTNCALKKTCGLAFMRCMDNVTEVGTSCATQIATYKARSSGNVSFYYACESMMCHKLGFASCLSSDVCLDYIGLPVTTSKVTTLTNSTAPVVNTTRNITTTSTTAPTSSASQLVAISTIAMMTCAVVLSA
jgi:hypothetical protein